MHFRCNGWIFQAVFNPDYSQIKTAMPEGKALERLRQPMRNMCLSGLALFREPQLQSATKDRF
jgi:hypothetical protein